MKILETIRGRLDAHQDNISDALLSGNVKNFEDYRMMTAKLAMIQQIREDILDAEKMYIED